VALTSSLLRVSHAGSRPTGSDQSRPRGGRRTRHRGGFTGAGASARAYRIATPGPAPSTESRTFTLERRGGRAIARPRAPARAEAHQRAGAGL